MPQEKIQPDGAFAVVFPLPGLVLAFNRESLEAALQCVVDLEARRDIRADHIKTPAGKIIRRREIKGRIAALGLTPTRLNPGMWTVVFIRDEEIEDFPFSTQLQALRYIAAGEDMGLIEALEIVAPSGYVMDRAGIDAALERNGLAQDWKASR